MTKISSPKQVGLIFFLATFFLVQPTSQSLRRDEGDGYLSLHNTHLGEAISVRYRKENGSYYNEEALSEINKLLRCRLTQQVKTIPVDLIELVDQIQDHFGGREVEIISGYRSPKLNETLRKKGRKVAKQSLHMAGWAVDIRIPGVSTRKLRDYALSLKRGGVGYYPKNGFVHVDIGRVRYW